jgi:hypothetical protein
MPLLRVYVACREHSLDDEHTHMKYGCSYRKGKGGFTIYHLHMS